MEQSKTKPRARAFIIALIFLICALPLLSAAEEEQPGFESSEDFEKSKQEFGQEEDKDKPPVSIRMDKDRGKRPERESAGKWGGWGGPMVGFLSLDLSPLDPMSEDRKVDGLDENLVLVGGLGGVAYYPNDSPGWWYIGGMGFGQEQSDSKRVGADKRRAKMNLGGGGIFVEYHYPLASKVDVGIGAMAGAGSLTLKAEGDDLGIQDDDWSENESFFIGYPYAGLGLQATDWMRLEAVAGYLFMEADLSGTDYTIAETNMDMTDGDLHGGPQYMIRVNFGARAK